MKMKKKSCTRLLDKMEKIEIKIKTPIASSFFLKSQ